MNYKKMIAEQLMKERVEKYEARLKKEQHAYYDGKTYNFSPTYHMRKELLGKEIQALDRALKAKSKEITKCWPWKHNWECEYLWELLIGTHIRLRCSECLRTKEYRPPEIESYN